MKNPLLIACILFTINFYAQNFTFADDNVLVDGKKIASVIKTRKGNMLAETMPEFTVYDVSGVARLLFIGDKGILLFLDDNKSYVSPSISIYAKSLAEFIAKDTLLTTKGYNATYKKDYIKKNGGTFIAAGADVEKGISTRNKKAGIYKSGDFLLQDNFTIGSIKYLQKTNSGQEQQIYNVKGKFIAKLNIENPDGYNMVKMNVSTQDGKGKFFSEFIDKNNATTAYMWLAENGYFDAGITEAKSEPKVSNEVSNINTPSSTINPYFSQTNEKLEALKQEAVKETNYIKAAEIKKELEDRQSETNSISQLEKDLEVKVKAEDFAAAAEIKEKIKKSKETKIKKDLLRKEIADAIIKEDFIAADSKKKELEELCGYAKTTKPMFKPVPITNQNNDPATNALKNMVDKSGFSPLKGYSNYQSNIINSENIIIYEFARKNDTIIARFSLIKDERLLNYTPNDFKGAWVYIWRGLSNTRFDLDKDDFVKTNGEIIFTFIKGQKSGDDWNKFFQKMKGKKTESMSIYFYKNSTTIGSRTFGSNINPSTANTLQFDLQKIGQF